MRRETRKPKSEDILESREIETSGIPIQSSSISHSRTSENSEFERQKSQTPKVPSFARPAPQPSFRRLSLSLQRSPLTRPTVLRICFWIDFLRSLRVVSRLLGVPLLATAAHIRGILADTIITISFPSAFLPQNKARETRVTVDSRSLSLQGMWCYFWASFLSLLFLLSCPHSAGYATG